MSRPVLVLALFISTGACSNGGSGTDGGSGVDATSDGGACLSTGAACSRNSVCVGGDCGGACCAGACLGDVDASVCTDPNVSFAADCAPTCTGGGDPSGTWHLVGACASPGSNTCPNIDAGGGAVGPLATLVVGAGNGTSLDVGYAIHVCSRYGTGSINGLGGEWSPDAGTIGGDAYCLQGSTLYIFEPPDPQNTDLHLTAYELTR